ncbi:MAG TPA: hypothetical protein VF718_13855 [Allosphingosinicella sp.]|jgi:hypothetical protein
MPRFFFHIHNGLVTHDEEGLELADADAAVREAHRGVRSMAAEQVLRSARLVLHHFVEVQDSNGDVVAKVSFRDAVAVED